MFAVTHFGNSQDLVLSTSVIFVHSTRHGGDGMQCDAAVPPQQRCRIRSCCFVSPFFSCYLWVFIVVLLRIVDVLVA